MYSYWLRPSQIHTQVDCEPTEELHCRCNICLTEIAQRDLRKSRIADKDLQASVPWFIYQPWDKTLNWSGVHGRTAHQKELKPFILPLKRKLFQQENVTLTTLYEYYTHFCRVFVRWTSELLHREWENREVFVCEVQHMASQVYEVKCCGRTWSVQLFQYQCPEAVLQKRNEPMRSMAGNFLVEVIASEC